MNDIHRKFIFYECICYKLHTERVLQFKQKIKSQNTCHINRWMTKKIIVY